MIGVQGKRALIQQSDYLSLLSPQNITVAVSRLIETALPGEHEERKKLHQEEMEKLAR